MACDPNQLLEAAKCFQCKYSSLGPLYDAVEIRLLCGIRDGEDLPCDPDYLANEARCILGCIPPGAMQAVKISILCDILDMTLV
jgi:hypothetical protein